MNKFKSDFERDTFKRLSNRKLEVEYEVDTFPYTVKRTYHPDFKVQWTRKGEVFVTYVETKGYFSPSDRQKMKLVKDQYPEIDLRMIFLSNNKLNKRSKTRYSDWCEKNNIPYAFFRAPTHWFK